MHVNVGRELDDTRNNNIHCMTHDLFYSSDTVTVRTFNSYNLHVDKMCTSALSF
jgi:hypothetical protein